MIFARRLSVATTLCAVLMCVGQKHAMSAESAAIAERIRPLIADHQGKVAVAIKHLETGDEFYSNADTPMPTASLIKFPVMVAAYRLVDNGKLDLNRMLTLKAEDKVQGSGILTTNISPGAQISIRDAIRLMIAYSDNTATNLVVEQIGLPTTAATMEKLGLPNTKLHAKVFRGDTSIYPERSKQFGLGSTTAREMIQLLEMLHQKKVASSESCQAMLGHLLACEDKDKFPRDLPAGTKIAHKTGSVNAVRTDAGILMSPQGPIAVCVLTAENEDKRWTRENAAEILCGRVARAVFDQYQLRQSVPNTPRPSVALATGAAGPLVESLQRTLNDRLKPSPELGVDGEFGPVTREAVLRFQKERQLSATGEVDAATWRALGPLITQAAPVPAPELVNAEQLARQSELDWRAPPLVTCKAWAIADGKTGVLLWGEHERQKLDFASTTKIMTAYLVLKSAAANPKVLEEVVTFSQRADDTIGSTADVRAGEQTTVRELLYGLLLPSGNDAATAFAEHFGSRFAASGSAADPLDCFVAEMNRTAESLGMCDTYYANPHGLTATNHQSTAADLLILARTAKQLPLFREYINTRQRGCTVSSTAGYTRNLVWKNTNKLLALDGYNGVKTGTTDAAGACLVSSSKHGDDELLMVVLGSANSDARYIDSRNLYRWAWRQR